MTGQQREKLVFTSEQMEDVKYGVGWSIISRDFREERRWYNVFAHTVQNRESGKYYRYFSKVFSGDYCDSDDETTTTLTEVFPVEKTTIVYE